MAAPTRQNTSGSAALDRVALVALRDVAAPGADQDGGVGVGALDDLVPALDAGRDDRVDEALGLVDHGHHRASDRAARDHLVGVVDGELDLLLAVPDRDEHLLVAPGRAQQARLAGEVERPGRLPVEEVVGGLLHGGEELAEGVEAADRVVEADQRELVGEEVRLELARRGGHVALPGLVVGLDQHAHLRDELVVADGAGRELAGLHLAGLRVGEQALHRDPEGLVDHRVEGHAVLLEEGDLRRPVGVLEGPDLDDLLVAVGLGLVLGRDDEVGIRRDADARHVVVVEVLELVELGGGGARGDGEEREDHHGCTCPCGTWAALGVLGC